MLTFRPLSQNWVGSLPEKSSCVAVISALLFYALFASSFIVVVDLFIETIACSDFWIISNDGNLGAAPLSSFPDYILYLYVCRFIQVAYTKRKKSKM